MIVRPRDSQRRRPLLAIRLAASLYNSLSYSRVTQEVLLLGISKGPSGILLGGVTKWLPGKPSADATLLALLVRSLRLPPAGYSQVKLGSL
jgi:hypothetical protein